LAPLHNDVVGVKLVVRAWTYLVLVVGGVFIESLVGRMKTGDMELYCNLLVAGSYFVITAQALLFVTNAKVQVHLCMY
jgi:hypothetical protein